MSDEMSQPINKEEVVAAGRMRWPWLVIATVDDVACAQLLESSRALPNCPRGWTKKDGPSVPLQPPK